MHLKTAHCLILIVVFGVLSLFQSCSGITVGNPDRDEQNSDLIQGPLGAFFIDTLSDEGLQGVTVKLCLAELRADAPLVSIRALPREILLERTLTPLGEFEIPAETFLPESLTLGLKPVCPSGFSLSMEWPGGAYQTNDEIDLSGSVHRRLNPELDVYEYYIDLDEQLLDRIP